MWKLFLVFNFFSFLIYEKRKNWLKTLTQKNYFQIAIKNSKMILNKKILFFAFRVTLQRINDQKVMTKFLFDKERNLKKLLKIYLNA